MKLYRQRTEKNLHNNFLSLQITSYWNSLLDKVVQAPNTKTFQYWKEYDGKYNFRSNYSPTANQGQEHAQTNVEETVEEPEI